MLRGLYFVLMSLVVSSVGCSSLPLAANKPLPTKAADTTGECTVEFQSAAGKNTVKTIPVQTDSTVEQVLERSGGKKFFGRMNIELVRKLPNGTWHKMGVEYSRGSRRVEAAHDYHVQAGDRLLIKEDPSTFLDDIIQAATANSGIKLVK
jgi:hypothetical protein